MQVSKLLSLHIRPSAIQTLLHVLIFALFWSRWAVRHSRTQPYSQDTLCKMCMVWTPSTNVLVNSLLLRRWHCLTQWTRVERSELRCLNRWRSQTQLYNLKGHESGRNNCTYLDSGLATQQRKNIEKERCKCWERMVLEPRDSRQELQL